MALLRIVNGVWHKEWVRGAGRRSSPPAQAGTTKEVMTKMFLVTWFNQILNLFFELLFV